MRILALSATTQGLDTLALLRARVPVAACIHLADNGRRHNVAGFCPDPQTRLPGVRLISVSSYTLNNQEDQDLLTSEPYDILFVVGWQRLVPKWLIDHCRIGVVGIHGSPFGITGGRGRSPQNWALILGESHFTLAIFWIDAGVDSGPVIAEATFPLDGGDDISTSYAKASCVAAELFLRSFENGRLAARNGQIQHDTPYYLPLRLPEDGALDWTRSSVAIDSFIRALTRPYPGAFTVIDGHFLRIWKGKPFTPGALLALRLPGTLHAHLTNGGLIIATGDGWYLAEDYEWTGEGFPSVGSTFPSVSFVEQMHTIANRHRAKHPEQPLPPSILRLLT